LKTLEEPPSYAKFILATTEKHKIIPTILSRCQIFDFARITIDDIARQLEFVARNEKVETEYDALHIIAQKADGAMRDALSIFDQIVSFAGNHVTYKAVVENLNVLDYDYFFAMTDHILSGNNTEILLLFNSIIDKGFEGAHFIGGFSSHLRNLLMCKEPQTIKLMDVGESIRKKYLEQASQCNPAFLLRALDMSNKCDISYRNANNRRLHVELTLLQIAALLHNHESLPQTPAAPALKTTPAAASQPAGNPGGAAPAARPASSYSTQNASTTAAAEPKSPSQPQQAKAVSSSPPPATTPSSAPRSLSIKINKSSAEDEKKKDTLTTPEEEEQRPEDSFTESDLMEVWNKLKENYRHTSASIFTALNTHPPIIIDDFTIEIGVDNLVQQDNIFEQKPQILSFLRKNLNNYALNFTIKTREAIKTQKAYLPTEKFQKMLEKNPALDKLRTDLDLDLIY
ncbi:MAG: DNA polymerase III subunit gamma/tau, partial [Bacteroidota bacterium]